MLGGRLPKTENKRICQTSGLKTGHGPLRNLSSGCLSYLQSGRLWEAVAYEKWSL